MTRMFKRGFKPKSTTKNAKRIIRNEIKSYDWDSASIKDQIDDFKSYSRASGVYNGYQGGEKLVDGGSFACYYNQTDEMLNKIYGKNNVKNWSNDKKWKTYRHLISREVSDIYDTQRMNLRNKTTRKK